MTMPKMVMDRTQADVDAARMVMLSGQISDGELKGCHEVSDLNRVEDAFRHLALSFASHGYNTPIHAKTWTTGDARSTAELERMRANLEILRGALTVFTATPATPAARQMEKMDYQIANAIEQILFDTDHLITNMTAAFRHSGAATCGMGGLIL